MRLRDGNRMTRQAAPNARPAKLRGTVIAIVQGLQAFLCAHPDAVRHGLRLLHPA
jgi:hypothetical protein